MESPAKTTSSCLAPAPQEKIFYCVVMVSSSSVSNDRKRKTTTTTLKWASAQNYFNYTETQSIKEISKERIRLLSSLSLCLCLSSFLGRRIAKRKPNQIAFVTPSLVKRKEKVLPNLFMTKKEERKLATNYLFAI